MTEKTTSNGKSDAPTAAKPKNAAPAVSRPRLVLVGALVIGFVIELLLHKQPFGLGYALAGLVVAAGWLALGLSAEKRSSWPALGLLAFLAVISGMVALRASPALVAVDVLTGMGLVLLIAAIYIPGRLHQLSLTDYAATVFLSGIGAIGQPFLLLFTDLPAEPRAAPPAKEASVWPAIRGLLLALPLLILFGGLFYAADAVFAKYVRQIFDWDIDFWDIVLRLILSLMLSWLAAGLLRHSFTREPDAGSPLRVSRPASLRLGATEATIVLALLNALFVSFVAIQAVYLFGGADTLARTGLTHSDYARRGFFELVTVAALVLSVILAMDWLTQLHQGRGRLVIHLLHGLLVALTLAVLVSALQRMRLYQLEYGLTELRFYTTAFMGWLAGVLIWLVATVLRQPAGATAGSGRRLFAFGALVAGLVLVLVLNVMNPDVLIARTNLTRAVAGVGQPLDAKYLTYTLSADAVPALLEGLPALPDPCMQAELARGLQTEASRLAKAVPGQSWRGANWSKANALLALNVASTSLNRYSAACPR